MLDALIALISTAIVIAAIYGLVFWANRARTDRSAIVGIYLLYGLPGALLTVAGTALMSNSDLKEGPFILFSGIAFLVPLVRPIRKLLASFTPMDPNSPIDMVGLGLLLWIGSFSVITAIQAGSPDVGSSSDALSENVFWLVLNAATFAAIAYVSVGYRIYRTGQEATARLGSIMPDLKTIGISLAMVIPCFVMSIIGGVLTELFQPGLVDNLDEAMDQMTNGLDNPFGAILIGLSAGIGEEVLIRGAVQPRFGIILASLFWTALHIQYDFSFVLVGLFGIGILLGLQRKYLGTTSAIITHAVYNMLVVLIQMAAN